MEPLERFMSADGEYIIVAQKSIADRERIILAVALHGNTHNHFVVWREGVDNYGDSYRFSGGFHNTIEGAYREYLGRTGG